MLETNELVLQTLFRLDVTLTVIGIAIIATQRAIFPYTHIQLAFAEKQRTNVIMAIATEPSVAALHTLAFSCRRNNKCQASPQRAELIR